MGAGASAADSGGRGTVTVVVNPATRRDAATAVAAIRRAAPADTDLRFVETRGPGDAIGQTRHAARASGVVVAVGGDGTVADVATGLRGSGVPLGIVPAGSTNIIARELKIPTDPLAAAALLFGHHRLARRDLGICGDRVFLHMAGAGFDSRFFDGTDPRLKRRVGWVAYVPAAARSLRMPPVRFSIVVDDQRIEVTSALVVVANGGSIISPRLRLNPLIRSDDGLLDLLIFTATGAVPLARTLASLLSLRLHQSPYVVRIPARTVEMTAHPPLAVQLDGDVVDRTPVRFTIDPAAIDIVAPLPADESARRGSTVQPSNE